MVKFKKIKLKKKINTLKSTKALTINKVIMKK